MAKHHGHKAQVLRSITGEYPLIDEAKTIYDLGIKMKSENSGMHQPKHNKDLETRPDAAYVHRATVTTKRKGQHC